MTIRERLARNKRRAWLGPVAGALIAAVGLIGHDPRAKEPPSLVLVGGLIAFASIVYGHHFALRCPRCKRNLFSLVWYGWSFTSINRNIRMCPYCGADFDAKDDAKAIADADMLA